MSLPRIFTPADAQTLRVRLAALPGHRDVKPPAEGETPLRMTSQIRVLKAAIEYVCTRVDGKHVGLRPLAKKWVVGTPAILEQLNKLESN